MEKSAGIPVISIIRVIPNEGSKAGCLQWFEDISACAARFSGHAGTELLIVSKQSGVEELMSIFRFDSYEQLISWEQSAERRSFLEKGNALFRQQEPALRLTGIEYLFAKSNTGKPPEKWKMITLTALIIFMLLHTIAPLCRNIGVALGIPELVISLLIVVMMVLLMTFVFLPLLTRVLHFWLYT